MTRLLMAQCFCRTCMVHTCEPMREIFSWRVRSGCVTLRLRIAERWWMQRKVRSVCAKRSWTKNPFTKGLCVNSGRGLIVMVLDRLRKRAIHDASHTCMCVYIVELRTPATPVGVGGGKERGGCHLNLRTWHAEGRRPILGLCWPSLGLCWPILRLCWPMPMRTKCCNLQHFALWDGKNPCKYNSFSPRKWLKHSYLQSFVHITIFDFLKNV